jgi:hypothetical protein
MKSKFGDVNSIQNGERVPIGYYKHNGPDPISNTRRDFETASYSETTEVPCGIYPIYAGWRHDGKQKGEATLYVEFKGKVTHDYFPSSFAGVIYEHPKPKNIGEERTVTQVLDVSRCIKSTGNSPNSAPNKDGQIPPDIFIDPKQWDNITSYYERVLSEDVKYFKDTIAKVESGEKTLKEATGTIRYCAACMQQVATTLEAVELSKRYLKNPTFVDLHHKNTKWVPTPQKTVNKKVDTKEDPTIS